MVVWVSLQLHCAAADQLLQLWPLHMQSLCAVALFST